MGFICALISIWVRGRKDRGLTNLPLSSGEGDVDETAGVLNALLGTALRGLLLLLWLDLS